MPLSSFAKFKLIMSGLSMSCAGPQIAGPKAMAYLAYA